MIKKCEHLDDCLERLLRGEALESCLKDYPEQAGELCPLLEIALGIRDYAETVKPSPQFIAQTQAKLGIVYDQMYHAKRTEPVGLIKRLNRLAFATALTIAAIVVTFTGGLVLSVQASENTMPGEILYPIKLATERVRLTLAFSNDSKVSSLTQFAETRARETVYAATYGNDAQVEATLQRLEDHLAQARDIVSQRQITGLTADSENESSILQKIENVVQASSARAKAKLEEMSQPEPETNPEQPASGNSPEHPSSPEKNKIIDRIDKAYSDTVEVIEKAKSDKPGKKPQ